MSIFQKWGSRVEIFIHHRFWDFEFLGFWDFLFYYKYFETTRLTILKQRRYAGLCAWIVDFYNCYHGWFDEWGMNIYICYDKI
jgi:hypothetical protein